MMILRPWAVLLPLMALSASAERVLRSMSLDTCQEGSSLYASQFSVIYTPDNNTASIKADAISSVDGKVILDITLNVYGYEAVRETFDPCTLDNAFVCPLVSRRIPVPLSNIPIDPSIGAQVPTIGYNFPDLDAGIRVLINRTDNGETVACLEARFSNDKTVNLAAIKWTTALVTLLGLITSAIMSGLGHTNTAAHLAASTLSLFGYFQAQAMVNLSGVRLPPAATAWTQNFVWSLGLIKVRWMQNIFTWFQRSTGGNAATLLDTVRHASVHIMKRSLDPYVSTLAKRANIQLESGGYVVYGIQRVGFQAKMETTNIFMTCITFFSLLVIFSALIVVICQLIVALAAKKGLIGEDRFLELRSGAGWQVLLKGVILRMTLLGFPAIAIFCLWEFTQVDSPALVVIAVLFFCGTLGSLGWASYRIIAVGRHSTTVYQTPSYLLFSNPHLLQKLGFLYVPFRATAYYYIAPMLLYIVIKAAIIALGQHNGTAQAVCLIIVEAAALGGASILRPWMDRSTNILNIAICAVNFVNAILLFLLSNVFDAPGLLVGISGILIFLVNAIFSLVLLLLVIGSSVVVFFSKNPDMRYRAMDDDRVSFWKSKTQLNTTQELDELAATARGPKDRLFNDSRSVSPDDETNMKRYTFQSVASRSQLHLNQREQRDDASMIWSPVDPSTPLARAGEHERRAESPMPTYRDATPSRDGDARSMGGSGHDEQASRGPWRPGNGTGGRMD